MDASRKTYPMEEPNVVQYPIIHLHDYEPKFLTPKVTLTLLTIHQYFLFSPLELYYSLLILDEKYQV